MSKQISDKSSTSSAVSVGRHAAECKICSHEHREEIERDYVNWRSPASIAKQFGLKNRSTDAFGFWVVRKWLSSKGWAFNSAVECHLHTVTINPPAIYSKGVR